MKAQVLQEKAPRGGQGSPSVPSLKLITTENTENTEGEIMDEGVGAKHASPIGYAHLDRDLDRDHDRYRAEQHLPFETWMNRMDRMLW